MANDSKIRVCFRFAGDFLHNSTTNCYLYKLAVCLRSGILSPGGATEVRQVQACDSTRSACSHKKRTGTHGMGDRRRCNFFKPRFLPPSHWGLRPLRGLRPPGAFGVLVIFLHTPGFGASVFGFAYAVTGRVFDSLACYALTGRCFAAPPRATGCRPPGSIIPRTPCAK